MKIAMLSGTFYPQQCGVSHYTNRLREHLIGQGLDVTVLTKKKAAQDLRDEKVIGVADEWNLKGIINTARYLENSRVDIIHIQHAAATYDFKRAIFFLPLFLKLFGCNKPVITTIHEYGNWEWKPEYIPQIFLRGIKRIGEKIGIWDREDGFLLTGSNDIIITNEYTRELLKCRLLDRDKDIHTIPIASSVTPIDINKQTAREKVIQTFKLPSDANILAYFGLIHPVKSLETLIEALAAVVKQRTNTYLLIIGGEECVALSGARAWQYKKKLEKLIVEKNLSSHVFFTGFKNDETVSTYLWAADIGVIPSRLGVSLKNSSMHAMLVHHLPIIGTTHPDVDKTIFVKDIVIKVEPETPSQIEKAILSLIEDKNYKNHYIKQSRDFGKLFSWEYIIKEHIHIYNKVSGCYNNLSSGNKIDVMNPDKSFV